MCPLPTIWSLFEKFENKKGKTYLDLHLDKVKSYIYKSQSQVYVVTV